MVKIFGYIGNVANTTTNRLHVFRVVCLDHDINNEVFGMFPLFLVAILCYVVGGSGLALLFLAPDGFYRPSNPDIGIYFLLVGLFFHAMSNALDYLKEIRDAVQKMAAEE